MTPKYTIGDVLEDHSPLMETLKDRQLHPSVNVVSYLQFNDITIYKGDVVNIEMEINHTFFPSRLLNMYGMSLFIVYRIKDIEGEIRKSHFSEESLNMLSDLYELALQKLLNYMTSALKEKDSELIFPMALTKRSDYIRTVKDALIRFDQT